MFQTSSAGAATSRIASYGRGMHHRCRPRWERSESALRRTFFRRRLFHTKPASDRRHGVIELLAAHLAASRNVVEFFQASAAARGRSVLRDEHRVTAKRRLLSIVPGLRRRESLRQQIAGVHQYGVEPLLFEIAPVRGTKAKAGAKCGTRQRRKNVVWVTQLPDDRRIEGEEDR
jgi:hypothetical protein